MLSKGAPLRPAQEHEVACERHIGGANLFVYGLGAQAPGLPGPHGAQPVQMESGRRFKRAPGERSSGTSALAVALARRELTDQGEVISILPSESLAKLNVVPIEILAQPSADSTGDRILAEIASGRWNDVRWAVAFAKLSGVQYVDGPLRRLTGNGAHTVVSVGIDHGGTSFEAASQLAAAVAANGRFIVTKDIGRPPATFHPKAFLFREMNARGTATAGLLISGSSNLTQGGLFTNHELSTAWTPNLSDVAERAAFDRAVAAIVHWQATSSGLAVQGDAATLLALWASGDLPTETAIAVARQAAGASISGRTTARRPRGLRKTARAAVPKHATSLGPPLVALPSPAARALPTLPRGRPASIGSPPIHDAFFIDITTGGRQTEVYLSKTALTEDPAFFGHPFTGLTTPKNSTGIPQPERHPRPIVDIRLIDAAGAAASQYPSHPLKMWQYANGPNANQDFRVTIPAVLLRALPSGCILEMRRRPIRIGIDYSMDFLTPGSAQHAAARAAATRPLPGGKRRWGWR